VKPAALKSVNSTCSRIGVLKEHLGELPLDALEEADEINWFKADSKYAKRVELATIHRTLETLRAAMNWGMAQTPPFFKKSPFHRYGVRMNKKAETARDRRLSREEEKQLLDAALQKMNTSEHQFVGPLLDDRIIGALELCCRRGEMLLIQNKRVNWETYRLASLARPPRTRRIGAFRSTRKDDSRRFSNAERSSGSMRTCSGRQPAHTSRNCKRPGKRCDCWRTASCRGRRGKAPSGIASNSRRSISTGTISGMKARVDSWPMASTSGSFN
jgi:hypothetical protein